MPNEIVPFAFENVNIRFVVIDGEPWFVASDVAKALGYEKPRNAVATHCHRARTLDSTPRPDLGRGKEINDLPGNTKIIPEPDVYRLISRSKLQSAERFESWLYEEVLPSIRKTGGYSSKPMSLADQALMHAQALVDHERRIAKAQAEALEAKEAAAKANERLDRIETAIDHFTVIGYASRYLKRSLTQAEASKYGRKATALCKLMELDVGTVPDPRFGKVQTYPKSVLDRIFSN